MAFHPFRDMGFKSLAVSVAALMWLSVAEESAIERGLEVPLAFENIPVGLEIASDTPDTVRVRLRGSSGVVSGLQPGQVVALLDLDGERPGQRLFDLSGGRVQTPHGVEVVQVVPTTITLRLEPVGLPRTVPIVPDIEGQPVAGFIVGRITTEPPTVDVVGPEGRVRQLREALTEPVSVDEATGRIEARVTVGVADPMVRLVAPLAARITVEIVPAPLERTLHEVPVMARNIDSGVRSLIEPAEVTVSIEGSRDLVRELDGSAVKAYVDLVGVRPGNYNLPVAIESAGDLGVTHIDPPSVRVTLR